MRNLGTNIPSRLVITGVALLAMLLLSAPSAPAAGGCPNEAARAESNTNPLTGQPYDMGLSECRAYEMVSPLEKQQHDALRTKGSPFISISPEGTAIEWTGEGDYAGAENYRAYAASPTNPYVAQRTASGWVTRSAYPPPTLIEDPGEAFGGSGVYTPNLAAETVCGSATSTGGEGIIGPAIRCALRGPSGLWSGTPEYLDLIGKTFDEFDAVGASRDGEDYVFYGEEGVPFLSSDTSAGSCGTGGHCGGIYEVTGIGTPSPGLRLVNVDNSGNMIGPENPNNVGPLLKEPDGRDYQAISADGSKIFFTATPAGGVPTVYARVNDSETVTISNPSPAECTTCNATPTEATYWGASANGEKVFFTTSRQLLNSDTDEGNDLYEYDSSNPQGHELVQISSGGLGDVTLGAGAQVQGVVDISEDGSHVYFVADGVLTTLPNELGQIASQNADNLYAYDTDTDETKFVATLQQGDDQLWGFSHLSGASGATDVRFAQTTPDGRYLVFDTPAELIATGPEADTSGALQVYRYDFKTGNILRVSLGHEGFADNGNAPGFDAVIGPAVPDGEAAAPTVNDADRAISENGETIAFVSAAQLQRTDVAGGANKSCNARNSVDDGAGCEVYVWHDGVVNMVSDGVDPGGALYAGMSATGADIFFQTRTQLVGQDTDSLGDIYDARIDGGFPAPTPEPSCSGEVCQGASSPAPAFAVPGTSSFAGSGNLTPGSTSLPPAIESKPNPKPPTKAQVLKLAKALKRCKKDRSKKKRMSCEKAANAKYGPIKIEQMKK